ncbi:MAG: glycosyltransferase family 4 protein [Deltaproteobacteria bacterium]|nr:glycosyltransferase family 4 protein [Deltaproteobacteria bacterium]
MNQVTTEGAIRRIAVLGNHMPRQCGIATFTTDLSNAIASEFSDLDCFVLAMNDSGTHHVYPSRVRFEVTEKDIAAYRRAADFLNVNTVDVVSVQHEYGIFGGKAGSHVLALLRELRMPIVTTLHTILGEPNLLQRQAMDELCELSERLVVMSAHGAALLREIHGVPEHKIDLIPHGIPSVPFESGSKDKLGVEGKSVILTLGLLSPDKGIEHVIDALPEILARCPDTVYIVLGATHPHVKERHGETYRLMLENRAKSLGVDSSMIFHNRFVSPDELAEFLSAADIYITPYLQPDQITSGTLAYAVGSGRAVISTPYLYARELLAEGRGILVPWRDPQAIAREVIGLLCNDAKRFALRERAAAHGRDMLWPAVARRYVQSFEQARAEHDDRRRTSFQAKTLAKRPAGLPEINLEHLRLMTDDTGVLQHALFSIPHYAEGYCLDDNARAVLLMALVEDDGLEDFKAVRALASRYLAFVSHAFNEKTGRFRNFLSYSRRWTEKCGSEDSHGRALWALGAVVGRSSDPGRQSLGGDLFHAALPAISNFTSPRAWAYALLGIDEYLRAFEGDSNVQTVHKVLAERLLDLFRRSSGDDWPWFEDRVTYCNARLSQALIVSGSWLDNEEMTAAGMRSLEWLASIQRSKDSYFAPIGSNGFYKRGEPIALFDQQPVEACGMVSACLDAYRMTEDKRWSEHARRAFNWFLGQNNLQQSLYDASTGGCRDGLHPDRTNENQGAESTLSFLLALLEMRSADRPDVAKPGSLELRS